MSKHLHKLKESIIIRAKNNKKEEDSKITKMKYKRKLGGKVQMQDFKIYV
jgi:hypothetical protein